MQAINLIFEFSYINIKCLTSKQASDWETNKSLCDFKCLMGIYICRFIEIKVAFL